MAIPEAQLETWSHQGATPQFTATYETIRNVLWDVNAPYAVRGVSVFLQGSYKNNTNVYGDSDVDIVISTDAVYYADFDYPQGGQPNYETGICFFARDGTRIENFPKQHSDNCTSKNQSTNWFKRSVRTYKNLRNKMIADGEIRDGLAPSYFIEGLLYNVPIARFGGSYTQNFNNTLNWLVAADRSGFECANGLYYLCHPTSPVTWRAENCAAFLSAAVRKRENWH